MKLAQNIVLISIMMGAMGAAIPSPAEEEAKRSSIPREESDTVFTWSPMKARDESDIVFTRSPMKVREDPVGDNIFTWSNLGARRVEVLESVRYRTDRPAELVYTLSPIKESRCKDWKYVEYIRYMPEVHSWMLACFSQENKFTSLPRILRDCIGSTDTEKDTKGGTGRGEEVLSGA
ncbi:hypothetical protein F5890DRAFT_1472928 [Lentinula detonsa]|uniref:Uncharacterized protein n=1 Tax=Lentinula detonsa TaxID=2804962 RepID=A0AA38Q4H8_9AGAR|nr:hypothetical protein F5890DRAFT_1472928 [Lentinula detonsa]